MSEARIRIDAAVEGLEEIRCDIKLLKEEALFHIGKLRQAQSPGIHTARIRYSDFDAQIYGDPVANCQFSTKVSSSHKPSLHHSADTLLY